MSETKVQNNTNKQVNPSNVILCKFVRPIGKTVSKKTNNNYYNLLFNK